MGSTFGLLYGDGIVSGPLLFYRRELRVLSVQSEYAPVNE